MRMYVCVCVVCVVCACVLLFDRCKFIIQSQRAAYSEGGGGGGLREHHRLSGRLAGYKSG